MVNDLVIGLVANLIKQNANAVAKELTSELENRNHTVLIESSLAKIIECKEGFELNEICLRAKILITLGGDGTVLKVINTAAKYGVAVMGINIGTVGFLSEAIPDELHSVLDAIDAGKLSYDYRNMLQAYCVVGKNNLKKVGYSALNEVCISRHMFGCSVRLDIYVNDEYLGKVEGDGVIVSTPTGSSAYSMSCGGPIINPTLDLMIITPVSGNYSSIRPTVVSGDSKILIKPRRNNKHMDISADGKMVEPIGNMNEIMISRSKDAAILAHTKQYRFYDLVRTKIYKSDNNA